MTRATSMTDAGFCPRLRIGTYAVWLRIDGLPAAVRASGVLASDPANANEAEVYAALCGVWLAQRRGAREVLVQSDSMAVIEAVRGTHRLYAPLWRAELQEHGLHDMVVRAKHVKGHTNVDDARSWVNRWCDAQCRSQLQKARTCKQTRSSNR